MTVKSLIILLGGVIFGFFAFSWLNNSGTLPTDPVTASATLDLKVKVQAQITVTIVGLTNRIKQAMASGSENQLADASLREDVNQLHNDVTAAQAQLITLGDSPAAVEQWLQRIQWPEFLALEAGFFKPVTGN